ncbi:MAG: ATP12 family protein [Erythrobacter sp.]
MKRFYDDVAIRQVGDDQWQVTLNDRGIRTIKGGEQIVPTSSLAKSLAAEWDEQGEDIDPKAFVFRDMADYAIDIIAADQPAITDKLLSYAETDTLCYRADPEDALFEQQQSAWEPLLDQLETQIGAKFKRISGIMHKPQSDAAISALRKRIEPESPFTLAGLEAMAALSASLLIAMMAIEQDADAAALWHAASLEEEWQAGLWGRDHEAEARREKRRLDFLNAQKFVALSQPQR